MTYLAQATTIDVPAALATGGPVTVMAIMLWWFMGQAKQDRQELLQVTRSAVGAIEKFSSVMERIERRMDEEK